MILSEMVDHAACLTVPARWPAGFEAVRRPLAALGVEVRALVNGPAALLPPPDDAEPPRYECAAHLGGPPSGWPHAPGYWWHRWATRLVLERAKREGARSLLLVEDDCVVAPDAAAILAAAEVPDDWQVLYLGAIHRWGETRAVAPGVLRVRGSMGTFAVLFRDTIFDAVLSLPVEFALDDEIARRLHRAVPCYAVWPNAAIQSDAPSIITGVDMPGAEYYEDRGVVLG